VLIHAVLVVVAAILMTQATVLATTIYLHRALAHRALVVHPFLDWLFRAVLWLTTGMRRQEWVAGHRKHHTFTDREGDPHSPLLFGFWKVQLFNVYYYAREAMAPDIVRKFAPDLVEDKWDRYVFSWGWSGLFLGTSTLCLLLGFWPGVIAMVSHGILYVFVLSPLINGLGHWRGAQNFMNTA
jgi:stearoyl-CoA desaturase (delta-9 desaturase)